MSKDKKEKKRNVRTRAERIREMERKLNEEKAKTALDGLKRAVKDGKVEEGNKKEFRRVLRHLKAVEKAGNVLSMYDYPSAAADADKLRQKLIGKLQNLLEEGSSSETENEEEEEEEEEEDEEDEEEDDDDDDDDDDDEEEEDNDDDDT